MKIRGVEKITLVAAVVSATLIPGLSTSSYAEINPKQIARYVTRGDRVSFYCGVRVDEETGKEIPTTMAYVPQRQGNIAIVGWQSVHFGAWNPQRRCEEVSPKFQTFYEDGRLNYLSNGENRGYPIICALLDKQEDCSGENQLFQVKPGTSPEEVIVGLKGILAGKSSQTIYQDSGKHFYLSVSEFLEYAPALEE